MFESAVEEGSLTNLLHSGNVVVASAYYTDYILALYLLCVEVQSCNRESAGRFNYNGVSVVHLKYGGADSTLRHYYNVVQHLFAYLKGIVSNSAYSCSVYKVVYLIQRGNLSRFQRALHSRSSCRLNANYLGGWAHLFYAGSNAGGQSASSYRDKDIVRNTFALLQYLHSNGGLPLYYLRVVEGWNEGFALLLRKFARALVGSIKVVACEDYLYIILSEHAHLLNLLLWCCLRHIDIALDA